MIKGVHNLLGKWTVLGVTGGAPLMYLVKVVCFNFFLVSLTLIFCKQSNQGEHNEDFNFVAPESTIYKYWHYLNIRDYKNALNCFTGHKDEYFDLSNIYPLPENIDSISVDTIISKKFLNKKTCEIYYRIRFYSHKDGIFKYFITGDKLILIEKGWLIDKVLIH